MDDMAAFVAKLSSADPVPGGGSVAALEAAMAAALLSMVVNLTLGRKRYAEAQEAVSAIGETAVGLCSRALELVEEDVQAYSAVSLALALPKATDEEKSYRSLRMQEALKCAVAPPLDTMRAASHILDLAGELVRIGNRSAISDVGTAAGSARAAFDAAQLNVEINLAAIHDLAWVNEARATLEGFSPVAPREQQVIAHVLSVIRG